MALSPQDMELTPDEREIVTVIEKLIDSKLRARPAHNESYEIVVPLEEFAGSVHNPDRIRVELEFRYQCAGWDQVGWLIGNDRFSCIMILRKPLARR